jgi:hypothetical protein
LGYTVDDTSPSKVGEIAEDYEILSRSIWKVEEKKKSLSNTVTNKQYIIVHFGS